MCSNIKRVKIHVIRVNVLGSFDKKESCARIFLDDFAPLSLQGSP